MPTRDDYDDLTPEQLRQIADEREQEDPEFLKARIRELEEKRTREDARRMYGTPGSGATGSPPSNPGSDRGREAVDYVHRQLERGDGLPGGPANPHLTHFIGRRLAEAVDQARLAPSYRYTADQQKRIESALSSERQAFYERIHGKGR